MELKVKKWVVFHYWVIYLMGVVIGIFLIALLFFDSIFLSMAAAVSSFVFTPKIKNYGKAYLNKKREQEFMSFIFSLSSLLSIGKSFENSFKCSVKELEGESDVFVIMDDLKHIVVCFDMNMSPGEGLFYLADKYKIESIMNFSSIVEITIAGGGSLEKVIDRTIQTISEKDEVEKELEVIITQKRFELIIMLSFVPLMIIYLRTVFGGFHETMYGSTQGRIVMGVCLMIYVLSGFVGKRIVDIKV